MIIAITGANGFIGKNLSTYLGNKHYNLIKISRDELNNPELLDNIIKKSDIVVHLAAKSSMDRSVCPKFGTEGTSKLSDYLDTNVKLTENLLNICAKNKIKKIIYTSSRMVYPSTITEPRTENLNQKPDSPYGMSKLIAEEIIMKYAYDNNFKAIVLRLSQVIGEGDGNRGILPTFINNAKNNQKIMINGKGLAKRDFIDVRDVCRAIEIAIKKDLDSAIINIGGEKSFSIKEFAEMVLVATNRDINDIEYKDVMNEDASDFSLNINKAKILLDWTPEWSIEKIIKSRIG